MAEIVVAVAEQDDGAEVALGGEQVGERGFEISACDGTVFRRRGGEGQGGDVVRAVGLEGFPEVRGEGFFHPVGAGDDFGFLG